MKWEDLKKFAKEARLTIDDQLALTVKELYPTWEVDIEITQEMIDKGHNRYQYNDKLYKCTQPHTTQSDWTPDVTPALWTVIDVEHAGTIDDPIPAVAGMEYIKGKYYIENDIKYLMNREGMSDGETIILQYTPSQLVGQYFEIV